MIPARASRWLSPRLHWQQHQCKDYPATLWRRGVFSALCLCQTRASAQVFSGAPAGRMSFYMSWIRAASTFNWQDVFRGSSWGQSCHMCRVKKNNVSFQLGTTTEAGYFSTFRAVHEKNMFVYTQGTAVTGEMCYHRRCRFTFWSWALKADGKCSSTGSRLRDKISFFSWET